MYRDTAPFLVILHNDAIMQLLQSRIAYQPLLVHWHKILEQVLHTVRLVDTVNDMSFG
jgi:hypothetical protein